MNRLLRPVLIGISLYILGIPLIFYDKLHLQRPAQTKLARSLFQGITYHREFRPHPRPLMIHTVSIDLTVPGIRVLATPGEPAADGTEFRARTTSEFLTQFRLQLAINANFFYVFREKTPWDSYPHSGDRVQAVGQAISNGIIASPVEPDWAALCFAANQQAQIVASGKCPADTWQAVAGSNLLVDQGAPVAVKAGTADSDGLYSRTAVGLDRTGKRLWIVAIDDKQPLYSEGVTQAELAQILVNLGVYTALNLDGGGSTTLVTESPAGATVLNSPIHTKLPMHERPVANHLGFYALPVGRQKEEG